MIVIPKGFRQRPNEFFSLSLSLSLPLVSGSLSSNRPTRICAIVGRNSTSITTRSNDRIENVFTYTRMVDFRYVYAYVRVRVRQLKAKERKNQMLVRDRVTKNCEH